MSCINLAPQIRNKRVAEVVNISYDCRGLLDTDELIVGAPTVLEVSTSDLTLGTPSVNTADVVINKDTVPAGKAVSFSTSGGVAKTRYTLEISFSTDATPAQDRVASLRLDVG